MLVGIYTRVSTQEQANEGYSLGEQADRLKSYAKAKDWTVANVYEDGGFSGGNTNRPALQKLINDVKRKKVDAVLVYKLDRLSRSQKDTLNLIEDIFIKNGVEFISMSENFDTSTPFGRAMIGILSVFAQLEREQIKERMQLGAVARAKDGYFHGGGFIPIGYDYANNELTINDYEAMQVREVYDLFLAGKSICGIRKIMAKKYTNKYGNWASDSTVKSCLTTPLYYGKIVYAGKVYDGRHEPIVSEELFNQVQERFKQLTIENPKRKTAFKPTTLLGGLIWCQTCGARYHTHHIDGRKHLKESKGHKGWDYYTCYSRHRPSSKMARAKSCDSKNWRVDIANQLVIDEILKLQYDEEYIKSIMGSKKEPSLNTKKATLEARVEEINKQLDKIMDLYQLGNIPLDSIAKRIEDLTIERDKLEAELLNINDIKEDKKISLTGVKDIVKNAKTILDSDDMEAKRNLVSSLIDRIELGDNIKIYWSF